MARADWSQLEPHLCLNVRVHTFQQSTMDSFESLTSSATLLKRDLVVFHPRVCSVVMPVLR